VADETRAAAAYGSKMNPAIVRSRVNAKGAIIALEYEQAADELVGYENDLHETLAEISPAPSVIEVRYYQEFQREVGAAKKKYGGGVLTREATALANLWLGRGLNYNTMKTIAYDLFGITIPSLITYWHESLDVIHTLDPESTEYNVHTMGRTARSAWSETYGKETFERAWLRIAAGEEHEGASVDIWIRWTPGAIAIAWPEFNACVLNCLPTGYHHASGLTADAGCFASLSQHQGQDAFDLTEIEEGVPIVSHFPAVAIPAGGIVELAWILDEEWEPDEDDENSLEIADSVEILFEEP
jgi:hypothetical protein